MYLSKIFKPSLVFLDLEFDCFDSILAFFSKKMSQETSLEKELIYTNLKKREQIIPTYIGNNTSLPHSRFQQYDDLVASFLRLKKPLLIKVNGKKEKLNYVICVLTSTKKEEYYLAFLSEIAQIMSAHPEFINTAKNSKTFLDAMHDFFHKQLRSLTAKDLALPIPYMYMHSTIKEVVDLMKQEQTDFVPILNKAEKICGVVSVATLIRAGLPDYLLNLIDLSFIKEFKPLEKFWDSEERIPVKDYMEESEGYAVTADTSYLEILFLMCKYNKKNLVTVDQNKKYIGVINQSSILNKMLRP